ncbi:hypothetical protein [Olleya sp. ITB9]|uniref:hypothetical protein n=1 Tax=Olleya sp. ITB9 TaxID=1715648 RepID=UPI0006D045DA|nr:hypothetical protein [Olleya sp. ITB9]
MNLEKIYRDELEKLRSDKTLLDSYSIDSAKDNNKNQIRRNRILIGLYNDCQNADYDIAKFLFNEEKKLRKSNQVVEEYEVEVLYLAAFILTKFDKVEDIWSFIDSKTTDFDSSIGFDTEYLLSFGIVKVKKYLTETDHPNKELALKITGINNDPPPYSQKEIDNWKQFKHEYFLVFKFSIKDEVDFAFQAKEYDYLKQLLPSWLTNKDNWSENQTLTSIAIGRDLQIDQFHLDALKHYVKTFKNSVRIKMYKKDIAELKEKLHIKIHESNSGDNGNSEASNINKNKSWWKKFWS